VDELLHEPLVVIGELLEQVVVRLRRRVRQLGGDLRGLPLLPHLRDPVQRLHLDEVDDALEVALAAPGQLQDERVRL
jgi:hypothetical protein